MVRTHTRHTGFRADGRWRGSRRAIRAMLCAAVALYCTGSAAAAMAGPIAATGLADGATPTALHVGHRPPAYWAPEAVLTLHFRIEKLANLRRARLVWRADGEAKWRVALIQLGARGVHQAVIPAMARDIRYLDYFVDGVDRWGNVHALFATAQVPHRVLARPKRQKVPLRVALAEIRGLRSELEFAGSSVDFRTFGGSQPKANGPNYYDTRVRFRYWLLNTAEYIEAGIGRMRGVVPVPDKVDNNGQATGPLKPKDIGYDRGWAQIGFRAHPLFGVHLRLSVGGDEQTFRAGAMVGFRIGRPRHTRLMLEAGSDSGVGGFVRAAFRLTTIPRIPVGFDILLTDYPDDSGVWGELVRLHIGWLATPGVELGLSVSYQALRGAEHGVGGGAVIRFRR